MELNILDIAPVLSDTRICINFLRGRNLLIQDYWCCGHITSKVMDSDITDKQCFQCNHCKKRISIRKYSFWEKSKLQLTILVAIMYFFAQGSNVTETMKFLAGKVTKKSVIQWYTYFRDIMTTYFQNNHIIFENCTVHIDETAIRGKRKYNRGRLPPVKTRWLFGIVDKTAHKAFVQFVEKRDFIDIIPIISRHVRPGCTIHTDGARVYKNLGMMNYIHNVCVHKENFVDPQTGVHSNWIENFWGNLKIKIRSIWGSQKKMLLSNR